MFEHRKDGVYYESGTGEDAPSRVTRALVVDAGDNVVAERPAQEWSRLSARFARGLRAGRLHMIGI